MVEEHEKRKIYRDLEEQLRGSGEWRRQWTTEIPQPGPSSFPASGKSLVDVWLKRGECTCMYLHFHSLWVRWLRLEDGTSQLTGLNEALSSTCCFTNHNWSSLTPPSSQLKYISSQLKRALVTNKSLQTCKPLVCFDDVINSIYVF